MAVRRRFGMTIRLILEICGPSQEKEVLLIWEFCIIQWCIWFSRQEDQENIEWKSLNAIERVIQQ